MGSVVRLPIDQVQARIGQDNRGGERDAVTAGFELAGAIRPMPGTGQVSDDLLYVLTSPRS